MRKIVWIGHFRGFSGFTTSTREYFKSILPYFNNLYLAPLEVLKKNDPLRSYLVDLPLNETELKVVNHQPTTDPTAECFFSVYEYNRIPDKWVKIFNTAKLIMTQSTFCKKEFASQIEDPEKIHVIPYIVPEYFTPQGPTYRIVDKDVFAFGSVFEWVTRKVPERTIRAFTEEFDKNESVSLILRSSHPFGKDLEPIINNISQDPRIILVKKKIEDIAAFYRGLDAYISCTAGEGWGQTLTEAMVCGIPTIASNHSGNLDFMNKNNSYLVDVHDWSPIQKGSLFKWKLPKIESIKEVMRQVYENREMSKNKIKVENALKLKNELNRESIGPKIAELLKKIV
ncbi:MAG: glycosyltransferase [Candidatus Lokiarchaeota archaeon]|nr:glycosyltransferase [Candidatus Lokiarchaeota archaeon]